MLGGARGTNEDAYAWARARRRPRHRRTATPSSATACRPSCSTCPGRRSTRPPRRPTVVLLGPDLKEELPVLYLRLRHAAEQRTVQDRRARPGGHRAHAATRGAASASRPAAPAAVAAALADHEVADQLARRPGRHRRRAGQPRRVRRTPRRPALRAVLDACPGATVLPALRRGNVVGALQLGLRPAGDGLDAAGILAAAADGAIDLLVLLGADPIADCPGRRPRPPGPRRRPPGHRRRHVPHRLVGAADVVLAAAAFGEKAGTTTNLEGRVTDGRPEGHGRRHGAAGLDDRRRAGRAARPRRRRRRRCRRSTRSPTPSPPPCRRTPARPAPRCAATRDGVLAVPAADAGGVPGADGAPRPTAISYDYRLVVDPQAVRPGRRRRRTSPSLAAARRRRRRPRQPARPRPARRRRRAAEVRIVGAAGAVVLPARRRRRRAARLAAGAVQRRRRRRSPSIVDAAAAGHRRPGRAAELMLSPSTRCSIGGLRWTPLAHRRCSRCSSSSSSASSARCSWSGSSARSSPACRTASGPNKAGPFGLLQTLADGMKLIFKEDFLPDRADRFVYRLAPFLAFVPAFLVWSVIPLGGDFSDGNDGIVTWFGHDDPGAARRPADRHPARARAVVDRRLRHHARRLVERLEVPAARRRCGRRRR